MPSPFKYMYFRGKSKDSVGSAPTGNGDVRPVGAVIRSRTRSADRIDATPPRKSPVIPIEPGFVNSVCPALEIVSLPPTWSASALVSMTYRIGCADSFLIAATPASTTTTPSSPIWTPMLPPAPPIMKKFWRSWRTSRSPTCAFTDGVHTPTPTQQTTVRPTMPLKTAFAILVWGMLADAAAGAALSRRRRCQRLREPPCVDGNIDLHVRQHDFL